VSDAGVGVVYVDTSALVKLVVREPESEALDRELTAWGGLATSIITSIELQRAVGRARAEERESVADDEAVAALLGIVAEIPLTARVRSTAKHSPRSSSAPSMRSTSRPLSLSATTSPECSPTTSEWTRRRQHAGCE
jgi:predicted nucleic acid-binding protein